MVVAAAGRTVVVTTGVDGGAELGSVEVVVEDCGDGVGALEVSVDPQPAMSETAAIPAAMSNDFFTDGTVAASGGVGPRTDRVGAAEARARVGGAQLSVPGGSLGP